MWVVQDISVAGNWRADLPGVRGLASLSICYNSTVWVNLAGHILRDVRVRLMTNLTVMMFAKCAVAMVL